MKEIGYMTNAHVEEMGGALVRWCGGTLGNTEVGSRSTVIELDSARCAGHDLLRSEPWRMVLWGAVMAKLMWLWVGRQIGYTSTAEEENVIHGRFS